MLSLYQSLLPLLAFLFRLARFLPALEKLQAPRRGLQERWRNADLGEKPLWFHVSSVGELEQVRPVMENLGKRYPVVLSFFSSSVPRLVKDWSFVRYADYLPLDFPSEMQQLMETVRPRLLVLNRYDLWPNHLEAARARGVPVVVVNASIPPLGPWGKVSLWARQALFRSIHAWTFVDAAAASAWEPYVRDRAKGLVAGDPRVDRALARVEMALAEGKAREKLSFWKREAFCLVAGSTWPEDEDVLLSAWARLDFPRSLLVVPHEPDAGHLRRLEKKIVALGLTSIRYSALERESRADVLIVDQRGILAELYGAGQLAFVGGGFRRHIHSIVEPAAHLLPVAFGPRFQRSPEAVTLAATGSALALPRWGAAEALEHWIRALRGPSKERERAEEPLRVFLQIHRGAGARVADFLQGVLGG